MSNLVIGVDEVGMGCLAGPVVTAAVVFPAKLSINGVRDSKQVSEGRRVKLVHDIDRESLFWVMAQSSAKMIDKYGLAKCHMACMKWCAKICLQKYPEATVVVDGVRQLEGVPRKRQKVMIKADDRVQAVGAASIMAKVHRDKYMVEAAGKWPHYWFQKNKGYGTRQHLEGLDSHGPCPEHRKSYKPVRERCTSR